MSYQSLPPLRPLQVTKKSCRCIERVPNNCRDDTTSDGWTHQCPFPASPDSRYCPRHDPRKRLATLERQAKHHESMAETLRGQAAQLRAEITASSASCKPE